MKNNTLLFLIILSVCLAIPKVNFGQGRGTSADFVLFSTVGAISNTGITHLTGHVGSNVGSSTGFGNVDGVMHDQDPASAQCATDLLLAYNQLNAAVPTFFPGLLLGNGSVLYAGVYAIPAAATLNLDLYLDAQGDSNALFILQINGAFSTNAHANVNLLNGAKACNVFWKVEGLVSMAVGTSMKGTVIAHNAAIVMNSGDTLEGRALAINGAITTDGILAYTPIGCGSPYLTGPANPDLGSAECYALFSGIGPVTNSGVTTVTGDVGTNSGLTTGFNPLFVAGILHPIPDGSTGQCATDFTAAYNGLGALPYDIELLYPPLFGNNLVLTPHVYLLNSAVTFTDTLFLNAEGNPNAVFVFQVFGAFSTSTYAKVALINGAQAKNVFWRINGAVDIHDYAVFNGSILAQGAINLYTGVTLNGRALTGVGALNVVAVSVLAPTGCAPSIVAGPTSQTVCVGDSMAFTVQATGIGLTYQWSIGNIDLVNGGSVSGVNTPTLILDPVSISDASSLYHVVISGTYLPNDTSVFVSLVVEAAPLIVTEPTDQLVCAGDNAGFSVLAIGAGLSYQWRKGIINMTDGATISGSTASVLTIGNVTVSDVAPNYNVVVSGNCPANDTSVAVYLNIALPPLIVTEPTDQLVCAGDNAGFTVLAIGAGLNYQWRKGTVNLTDGGTVSGSATPGLTIANATGLDAATNYNVIVSGNCPANDSSTYVALTVNDCSFDLSITKVASNMKPKVGSMLTFTVVVTNTTANIITGTEVIELLQSGYTYLSSTTTVGSFDPVSGNWIIGTISGGASETMTLIVVVMGKGDYMNAVSVSCIEPESDSLNNTATVEPIPIYFFIPEGFSPNGDLVNDLFVIQGITDYANNDIVIFNRWGNKVFKASPYENDWDGRSQSEFTVAGGSLPVGTYFYVLHLGDGSDEMKGTVYLNK